MTPAQYRIIVLIIVLIAVEAAINPTVKAVFTNFKSGGKA